MTNAWLNILMRTSWNMIIHGVIFVLISHFKNWKKLLAFQTLEQLSTKIERSLRNSWAFIDLLPEPSKFYYGNPKNLDIWNKSIFHLIILNEIFFFEADYSVVGICIQVSKYQCIIVVYSFAKG